MSALFSFLMRSTTRQSAHIFSRSSAPGAANIEWPESFPSIVAIILSVPSGLPQRMHLKIAASLSTRGALAPASGRAAA